MLFSNVKTGGEIGKKSFVLEVLHSMKGIVLCQTY